MSLEKKFVQDEIFASGPINFKKPKPLTETLYISEHNDIDEEYYPRTIFPFLYD